MEQDKNLSKYLRQLAAIKWEYLKSLRSKSGSYTEDINLFKYVNPAHITTKLSPYIERYEIGASFKILLSNFILEKKFYNLSIAPGVNDKINDSKFLQNLGYPVPTIFSSNATVDELNLYSNCLIKPKSGAASLGVFVKKSTQYIHVYDKIVYNEIDFRRKIVDLKINRFIVEDVVGGVDNISAIRDFKFYCFYGRIGLVLEILRGANPILHCFYDSDVNIVNTGKYSDSSFVGKGVDPCMYQMASEISLKIPAPFIRIDFIESNNNIAVGELTAHPGGFENFSAEWDHKLGLYFLEARAKLFEELLDGKKFDEYISRKI